MTGSQNIPRRGTAVSILLAWSCLWTGCGPPDQLDTTYGTRSRGGSAGSVNGTHVLFEMFRRAGFRVSASRQLGRSVQRADAVVWFPDRFRLPDETVREYFADWLWKDEDAGRTLVYVARDFDAAIVYWEQILAAAPADQALEIRQRLAHRKAMYEEARSGLDEQEDCDWFAVQRDVPPRRVSSLEGPWHEGIDTELTDIRLRSRLARSDLVRGESTHEDAREWQGAVEFTPLLTSDDELLVAQFCRENWGESNLIVVANGSWLLNGTLVNHEHRKLAARLIEACGPPGRVVFLETGPGDPWIADKGANAYHGLVAFTVWPVNCILMHLTVLGLLFCCYVFPIFGRPQTVPPGGHADFGKHIRALGKLLVRTEDAEYARCRLRDYYEKVKPDAVMAQPPMATRVSEVTVSPGPVSPDPVRSTPAVADGWSPSEGPPA